MVIGGQTAVQNRISYQYKLSRGTFRDATAGVSKTENRAAAFAQPRERASLAPKHAADVPACGGRRRRRRASSSSTSYFQGRGNRVRVRRRNSALDVTAAALRTPCRTLAANVTVSVGLVPVPPAVPLPTHSFCRSEGDRAETVLATLVFLVINRLGPLRVRAIWLKVLVAHTEE